MAVVPKVTVVLPVWNGATTLARAARSILNQTHDALLLRIVDDGSTDETPEIAAALAREDRRVSVTTIPHGGIVRALQVGTELVYTPYLARMDADDVSHPERLAEQVALLERTRNMALCGTQVRMVGEQVGPGRLRYEAWLNSAASTTDCYRETFIECPVAHPTFCIHTKAFYEVGGYREVPWPEDYDLVFRVMENGWSVGNVPRVLLDWTERGDRLSMNDERYSPAAFRAVKRRYLETLFFRDDRSLYQWGAGEVGKPWLREWTDRKPVAVVDIRPGKIGQRIHGVEVIPPESLPGWCEAVVVIAVGTPGARELIRGWLNPRGYHEMVDYVFLA